MRRTIRNYEEGKLWIEERKRFLDLTFAQVIHPVFGTPKWEESCLLKNRVGPVVKTTKSISFVSTLETDEHFHVGHCESDYRANFVYLYCIEKEELVEIRCFEEHCPEVRWEDEC